MDAEPEIVFTEVPPWITPYVKCCLRLIRDLEFCLICAMARPIAWIGLGAKVLETVTTSSGKCHLITVTSCCRIDHPARILVINRDKCIYLWTFF